jgi:hypothetical protein
MNARLVLLLVMAGVACGRVPRGSRFVEQTGPDASLVGAWDASLSLTHAYPLGRDKPAARRICGTMGFVHSHQESGSTNQYAPAVGVYDLELSRLGLNWLDDNTFPAALASTSLTQSSHTDRTQQDSITIVLNPGSSERIVLLGRHDVVGIDGDWVAQSARGTATGSFSLRPHLAARPIC